MLRSTLARAGLCCLAALAAAPAAPYLQAAVSAQAVAGALAPNVREDAVRSATLAKTVPYRVILPAAYASSTRTYPVLYLLHGYGGGFRNWTEKTDIAPIVAGLDVIVVTPEGANSWYVNGENGEAWETFVADELIADVEQKFRAAKTREGRGIAGLSMGGYGAVRIGLAFPARFSFAGSLSGAFDITRDHDVFTTGNKVDVTPIFGRPGSTTRANNDVYAAVSKADPTKTPYIYMAEGTRDPWLEPNRELVRALDVAKVPYEYHETPGTHDWTFWGREVGPLLARFLRGQ